MTTSREYRRRLTFDPRLPIQRANYTRTLWTRDAYGTPSYTNLYGAHPIFVNQKVGANASANGVYFLNSHGMDIKFPNGGEYIEYNTLGGVVDLFFFAGPGPADVAKQATEVWGKPAEVPYWSLGVSWFYTEGSTKSSVADVSSTAANMGTSILQMSRRRLPT
jgi:alpha-glucosidase (family GH31 glycosyl hydrolase)